MLVTFICSRNYPEFPTAAAKNLLIYQLQNKKHHHQLPLALGSTCPMAGNPCSCVGLSPGVPGLPAWQLHPGRAGTARVWCSIGDSKFVTSEGAS